MLEVVLKVKTYWAKIFLGLKQFGVEFSLDKLKTYCQEYVNKVGLCITVTPTFFVYSAGKDLEDICGMESGAIIGLINYPRYPSDPETIKKQAINFAEHLKNEFCQDRISIMFPDETIMIGKE